MKFIRIVITAILIYTVYGIPLLHASSIDPGIERITLAPGQTKQRSVLYNNTESTDVEILITPYAYNPKTDDISEDKRNIFIKADTDSITVRAKSSFLIKYEVYPLTNIAEGTYFNILALTPVTDAQNVKINTSVAQLIILDVVSPENEIKGIATTQYSTELKVIRKGIPFISPLVLRYTIKNSSNYLLTPQGRIDIFNGKNSYEPIYLYLNTEKEEIYPGESIEKEIEVKDWHLSDFFLKRIAMGEVYNGIDNNPQYVGIEINNFIFELAVIGIAFILAILFFKSVKQDLKKKS